MKLVSFERENDKVLFLVIEQSIVAIFRCVANVFTKTEITENLHCVDVWGEKWCIILKVLK
jgi:hypothetical protein